ncbi:MAG: hypothetical protein NTY57_06590 [Solirubrobacterales bacterium]|nr:hypothetical protein [Solirubrobacterales bacterium]
MLSRPAEPTAPLVAGVAQKSWRQDCPGPVDMIAEVVAAAAADAGPERELLNRVDALCVVRYVSAEHPDPARLIADKLGIEPRERIHTSIGGDTPQAAIGELAGRIAAGEIDVAVVCGGEALRTLSAHMKAGTDPGWNDNLPDSQPVQMMGVDRAPNTDVEMSVGCIAPLMIYPLFEHALWATEGGTLSELQGRLGSLKARFASVASENPHAWGPSDVTAEYIATPSPANRQVTMPYTKLMNSNIQTDQAAAVILMSDRVAQELGVEPSRRVYIQGAAHATEPWFFSQRDDLGRSPAMGHAIKAAMSQASTDVAHLEALDLYSCFPCAVRIAGREIGFDPITDPRSPTVTGGLGFAGGPGNAYVIHSVAAMVTKLREGSGGPGLVTAVGWYLTKHAAGVYGLAPPEVPFELPSKIEEPAAAREVAVGPRLGSALAETATIIYERDGSPSMGILTAILPDGRRALRNTINPDLLAWINSDRPVTGRPINLDAGADFLPLD